MFVLLTYCIYLSIEFFAAVIEAGMPLQTLLLLVVVLFIPYLFFIYCIIPYGRYGPFLWTGSIVSKLFAPFITIYIFCYALYKFDDIGWGVSHGAAGPSDAVALSAPVANSEDKGEGDDQPADQEINARL